MLPVYCRCCATPRTAMRALSPPSTLPPWRLISPEATAAICGSSSSPGYVLRASRCEDGADDGAAEMCGQFVPGSLLDQYLDQVQTFRFVERSGKQVPITLIVEFLIQL